MNDLFFSSGAHAMHIDRAPLHDIKTFAAIAFAKKIIPLIEMFWDDERRDGRDISCWQSHEQLATTQRVFGDDLPELARFERHAEKLSGEGRLVSPKNVIILRS